MKSRLMSYLVCRDHHFAENLIYFNRSNWVMHRISNEIDIDIDVVHRLVKCMYPRVEKIKPCPMSHIKIYENNVLCTEICTLTTYFYQKFLSLKEHEKYIRAAINISLFSKDVKMTDM